MSLVKKDIENFGILNWLDKYMIGHKGFIAGGCFKNIFQKEKVKDIDIFFESIVDWEDAVHFFDKQTIGYGFEDNQLTEEQAEYRFLYENEKVKAYKNIKTGIRVELCKAICGTAEDVINNFDFTITKFAYYKVKVDDESGEEFNLFEDISPDYKTHIEYRIICNENFFEHLHLYRLVTDDKILFPASTFERMIRYIGYGYKPCKETKLKIMKAIHDMTEEEIAVGKSLYNGLD